MKKLLIILSAIFLNFTVVKANDNTGGIKFNAEGETISIIEANFEYPSVKVKYSNLEYLDEPIDGVTVYPKNILVINGEISSLLQKLKFKFIDKTAQANINFYFYSEKIDNPDIGTSQASYSLFCELKLSMNDIPEPTPDSSPSVEPTESPVPTNTPAVNPTATPTASVNTTTPVESPVEASELPNEITASEVITPSSVAKIEKPVVKPKEEKELVDNTDKVKITLVSTEKSNNKTSDNTEASINIKQKSNNAINSISILISSVIVLSVLFVYQLIKYLFIIKK